MQLDTFDKKIIGLLQQDASLSAAEVGERVGLSQSQCWRRIERLEKDGVFKSWAVPKGLPESPGLKRLAVQVEDHDLEFAPFHEANPGGESLKGRIKVWDHGTYELEEWTADRIVFDLNGSRISGKFSLFRFKESEPLSWFLIKRRSS